MGRFTVWLDLGKNQSFKACTVCVRGFLAESPEGNLFPYVTSLLYIFLVICLRSAVLSTNILHALIHVTSRQMQTLTIGTLFNDNCHLSCEFGLLVEVEKLLSNKMSSMK